VSGVFKLTIVRFDPSVDTEPHQSTYEVPDDPSSAPMTALKALHYINRFCEPIGYDYNCRRGTCGRCAMIIDGTPRLACYFILTGEHLLEPLKGCRVIRDLVVDKSTMIEKFIASSKAIETESPNDVMKPISGDFWRDTIYPINACRECMCCYSVCQISLIAGKENPFLGPGALQQIYLRAVDGMDQTKRVEQAVSAGLFDCIQCGMCTLVCPSRITCSENIKDMMDAAIQQGFSPKK
jgi:succinate dehydrogenase/fumarate reductase iron-sulfur protein